MSLLIQKTVNNGRIRLGVVELAPSVTILHITCSFKTLRTFINGSCLTTDFPYEIFI